MSTVKWASGAFRKPICFALLSVMETPQYLCPCPKIWGDFHLSMFPNRNKYGIIKRAIAMSKNITAKLQQMLSLLRAKVRAPIVCPNCGTIIQLH